MTRPTDPRLIDELTGLSNEWHFRILFDFAFAAGGRGIPLALALFEIDDFQDFRRREGSDRATAALRRLGSLLGGTTREMDVTCRLHGSRFLTLLRDCNLQGGLVFVDRVQLCTGSLEEEFGLTVASGVAAYDEDMKNSSELFEAAGKALAHSIERGSGAVTTPRDR